MPPECYVLSAPQPPAPRGLRAATLALALKGDLAEVAAEHHEYEQTLDAPDEDWPAWYAAKLVERGWNR